MRRQEVTFRITKINKRAVAVAVCALTGIGLPSLSRSADIYLGSDFTGITITGTQRTGDTFYTGLLEFFCDGVATTAGDSVTCTDTTYTTTPDTTKTSALRIPDFRIDEFSQILTSSDNYFFGVGAQVDDLTLGANGTVTPLGGNLYRLYQGLASTKNLSGEAINITGKTTFYGENDLNGSVIAGSIDVLGAGVRFNSAVTSTGTIKISDTDTRFMAGTVSAPLISITGGYTLFFGKNVNLSGNSGSNTNLLLNSNSSIVIFSGGNTVTGNISSNGSNATVNFLGSATITGAFGVLSVNESAPIGSANVNGSGSFVNLNTVSGNSFINSLNINARESVVRVNGGLTGSVTMNGHASLLQLYNQGSAPLGMVGLLYFGTFGGTGLEKTQGTGTLEVGNGVSMAFGKNAVTQLSVFEANNATLVFSGNSMVSTTVGSARTGEETFNRIWAGSADSTVEFLKDVYVYQRDLGAGTIGDDSYTGQLRTGSGTVNLQGNLYGNLVIGSLDDEPRPLKSESFIGFGSSVGGIWGDGGTVSVADGKTVSGSITTNLKNTGVLTFLGASNYVGGLGTAGQIGADMAQLHTVNFNATNDLSTVTNVRISNHVYSNNTNIGNNDTVESGATVATLISNDSVGSNTNPLYLGGTVNLISSETILNTDQTFGSDGKEPAKLIWAGNISTGRLSNVNTVRVQVGGEDSIPGYLLTAGATLNFAVDANGSVIDATSSQIRVLNSAGNGNGTVTISNSNTEKYNIVYLGSLASGETYKLITGTTTGSGNIANELSNVADNSYVINSSIMHGSIELLAQRANDEYITKSKTLGEISNPAALRLGTLGAAGTGYSSDMQVVFNKLDIDQWGYGNNEANLATQVRRLIPIANNSDIYSALSATSNALSSAKGRLSVLRGDSYMAGLDGTGQTLGSDQTVWAKVIGGTGKGDSIDGYDGFKTDISGLSFGFDALDADGVVGLMGFVSNSDIKQDDFRSGDTADLLSAGLGIYFTQEFGPMFVEGALAYTHHNLDSTRAAVVGRTAKADVDYNEASGRIAAGYRFAIDDYGNTIISPTIAVEHSRIKQEAYTETNAGDIGLEVDARSLQRTRASLGISIASEFETSNGVFYPELYVGYNSMTGLKNTSIVANYIGDISKQNFTTVGVTPKKSSFTVAAGLRYAAGRNTEIQLGYKFEGDKNLNSHQASVRASWAF